VEIPWPATRRDHSELTSNRSVGRRRERRGFLVSDVFPGDIAVPSQRVGKAVERVAGDAADATNSRCLQCCDDFVGNGRRIAPLNADWIDRSERCRGGRTLSMASPEFLTADVRERRTASRPHLRGAGTGFSGYRKGSQSTDVAGPLRLTPISREHSFPIRG
jgi:hypothetical protein